METTWDIIRQRKLSGWDFFYALDAAIACLISYAIVTFILSPLVDPSDASLGGTWAAVSTMVVFRITRADSIMAGVGRLVATGISFLLCLAYLLIFPFHLAGLAVLVGLGTLITIYIGRRDDIVTTGVTTIVIMIVAARSPEPAWHQPLLRLGDTAAGIAVGVVCKWIASSVYVRITGRKV